MNITTYVTFIPSLAAAAAEFAPASIAAVSPMQDDDPADLPMAVESSSLAVAIEASSAVQLKTACDGVDLVDQHLVGGAPTLRAVMEMASSSDKEIRTPWTRIFRNLHRSAYRLAQFRQSPGGSRRWAQYESRPRYAWLSHLSSVPFAY